MTGYYHSPSFDPMTSDLTGIDQNTLRQWLIAAQTALFQLSIGGSIASVSYGQGDGNKAVTYRQADLGKLGAFIALLKAQLGISSGRRPIRFSFV